MNLNESKDFNALKDPNRPNDSVVQMISIIQPIM